MSSSPPSKRILLIIGGGIAAYKVLELIRRLRERGVAVRCVLTKAGAEFVTPLSVGTLSGGAGVHRAVRPHRRARDRPHPAVARGRPGRRRAGHRRPDGQDGARPRRRPRLDRAAGHRQAGAGRAGDEPAMWAHPATQRNVATLRRRRRRLRRPGRGRDGRRGESGLGRMAEPPEIVAAIDGAASRRAPGPLAGPPRRSSPPARRTSRSTRCATSPTAPPASRATPSPRPPAALGARGDAGVGPGARCPTPPASTCVHVETAREMLAAVRGRAAGRHRHLRRRRRRLAGGA